MVTGAEVGVVVKAGAGIVQGLQKTQQKTPWPQVHEALMELVIILDEWCDAALQSNRIAEVRVDACLNGQPINTVEEHSAMTSSNMRVFRVGPFLFRDYIAQTTNDIESLLSPAPPWVQRWRASKRRAAGRRTLESILRICEPDLLHAFQQAVAQRAEWVTSHRERFDDVFAMDRPVDEVIGELQKMEDTLAELVAVRQRLLVYIKERYPSGPIETVR